MSRDETLLYLSSTDEGRSVLELLLPVPRVYFSRMEPVPLVQRLRGRVVLSSFDAFPGVGLSFSEFFLPVIMIVIILIWFTLMI